MYSDISAASMYNKGYGGANRYAAKIQQDILPQRPAPGYEYLVEFVGHGIYQANSRAGKKRPFDASDVYKQKAKGKPQRGVKRQVGPFAHKVVQTRQQRDVFRDIRFRLDPRHNRHRDILAELA